MAVKRILNHPIFHLMTGSTLSQAITLAFMPVISRLYDPTNVGVASVFMNYATICLGLLSFQYDQALYTTKNEHDIIPLKRLVGILILISSSIMSLVYLVLYHYSVLGFRSLKMEYVFFLLPLLIVGGFARLGRISAVKAADFKAISKITATGSFISNCSKALLGALKNSAVSFIIGEMLLHVALFIAYFRRIFTPNTGNRSNAGIRGVAKKYQEYSTYGQLSVLFDMVAMAIPLQFITTLFGSSNAGIYAFAFRIVSIANSNLGSAITDVFISRFSEMYRNRDFEEAKHFFKKMTQKSLIIAAPIGVALMIIPPFVFGHIFGEAWHEGGTYCAILTPWVISSFIVSPLSNVLIILQKQKYKLIYDIFALTGSTLVFILSHHMGYEIKTFLLLLTASQVASYILYFAIIYICVNKIESKTTLKII